MTAKRYQDQETLERLIYLNFLVNLAKCQKSLCIIRQNSLSPKHFDLFTLSCGFNGGGFVLEFLIVILLSMSACLRAINTYAEWCGCSATHWKITYRSSKNDGLIFWSIWWKWRSTQLSYSSMNQRLYNKRQNGYTDGPGHWPVQCFLWKRRFEWSWRFRGVPPLDKWWEETFVIRFFSRIVSANCWGLHRKISRTTTKPNEWHSNCICPGRKRNMKNT